MQNYRYHTPEYARRGNCGGRTNVRAAVASCQALPNCGSMTNMPRQAVSNAPCCEDRSRYDTLSGMAIAMAYVPWQEWRAIFEVEKGFQCGTIFEELNKPFQGMGGCC